MSREMKKKQTRRAQQTKQSQAMQQVIQKPFQQPFQQPIQQPVQQQMQQPSIDQMEHADLDDLEKYLEYRWWHLGQRQGPLSNQHLGPLLSFEAFKAQCCQPNQQWTVCPVIPSIH